MHVQKKRFHVGKIRYIVLRDVIPKCLAGRFGVLHHERQFEHFNTRKTPGREPGRGEHNVGNAVLDLIV